MAKALRFDQIECASLQLPGAATQLLFGLLSVLDLDTRSIPLDDSSIAIAQRKMVVQHPAIFPVSPPYYSRSLEALATCDRLSPLLHKSLDIFRMHIGSPFPTQEALSRLPAEAEPLSIEEIQVPSS